MFKGKFNGIRKTAGQMNKTETIYADQLYLMKLADMIESYRYESVKFKVFDGSWYTPDFMVICKDHIEFHEVKGSYMLDKLGKSKFMQACNENPEYRWLMVSWQNKEWVTLYDNSKLKEVTRK